MSDEDLVKKLTEILDATAPSPVITDFGYLRAIARAADRIEELERERDEANDNARQWAKDYAASWNEAIEAAAKVADSRDLSIMSSTIVDVEARTIAKNIRALKRP